MVNLSRLNLMDAAVPASLADMDVVLCRNVLMYFSPKGVRGVLDKLWDCLSPGGWLIATPSESALLTTHGKFEPVNIEGTLFFRKNEQYKPHALAFSIDSSGLDNQGEELSFSGPDYADLIVEEDRFVPEWDLAVEELLAVPEPVVDDNIPPAQEKDGNLLLERAAIQRSTGNLSGAVEVYREILAHDYGRDICIAALLGIAGVKADSGFADEAGQWCERAIELDRVNPRAHFLLGQIFLQQEKRERAVTEMRNAVFLDSGFIMAHVLLGNIYLESSDKNAAIRHFRIAIQELDKMEHEDPVPFSDRTTAGRLLEMVRLVRDSIG
jgi:chemotaxis protein methyltransferase CheR